MKKAILLISLVMVMVWQAFSQNAPISTIGNVNSNLAAPEVPITVQNFTNITDCQLRILYDPAVINATGVAGGPGIPGTLYANISSPGVIVITWFNWPPVDLPDHSTIFRLQFTKVATGSSSLTFEDDGYSCYWGDGDYQILNDTPFSTYYIAGSLRVGYAPVTTAPAITACPGQTISVPVTVTDFDNIGRVYGLRMTYNSAVLTYNGYTNTSGFTGLTVANSVSGGTGTITAGPSSQIAGTSGVTYADNSVLFTMSFTYNGGTSNLTWSDPASPGTQCLYMGPAPTYTWLTDTPTASFYINGLVEPLVAPTIIKDPDLAGVCITTPVSATFGSGSGGVSAADNYESSIDGGSSWQSYTPGTPLTAATAGNAQIQVRAWRTSVGTACTNSGYVYASWNIVAESAGGILSGGTAHCAGPNSTLLSLSSYNGAISSWQYSEDGSAWNVIAHTADTYTAANLITTTQYRVVVQNGICNPEYSTVETITINPVLPVSVTINADQNPLCTGEEVVLTATPVNGGGNPQFQWYLNSSPVSGANDATYAYIPADGDAITCELTSDETCTSGNPAMSNQVVITVNPLPVVNSATIQSALDPMGPWSPVSGTLSGGYTMCIDPAVANYYLDIDQFDVNPALLPGHLNGFSLDINNLPPTWWSYWSDRGVNGPSGNQYPWQDQMWLIINGLAPIFYIYQTGGDDQLIDGLTWQISGQYTPLRLPGDYPQWNYTYQGKVTDVNNCISSFFDVFLEVNTIPVMTDAELTYSLSPSGPWEPLNGDLPEGYSICIDPDVAYYYLDLASVSVSQTLLDGHLNPFFVRQDNLPPTWLNYWSGKGVNGPSGNQYPWQDQMWLIINGDAPIFYIYESAGDPQLIDGLTYQMGGGITPLRISGNYPQWNYSYNGTITDENYCISSFFDVFMEINTIPGVDPVAGQEYCNGDNTSEIILTSGVPGTTFTWANSNPAIGLAGAGTGNIPAFTATNPGTSAISGTLTVTPESNGCSGSPVALFDFTIHPTIAVSVTIEADETTVCAGTTVQFTATPVNGGSNPAYQWTVNGLDAEGATNVTFSYMPANGDAVRCMLTSDETLCVTGNPATSDPVVMSVNPLLPVSVSIAADADPVCEGTTVTFTATPVNGGLTPSYQWFVNDIEMTGFHTGSYAFIPVNGDEVYCILTGSETCQSGSPATSGTLTATVNPVLPVSVTIAVDADPVCAGTTVTYTATPVNGGATPSYQWFVNGIEMTGFNSDSYAYIPANSDEVYCILSSSETCKSGDPATSDTLTATVNSILPVSVSIAADANPVCTGTTVTYTATPINGGAVPSYQWFVNGMEMIGFSTDTYAYIPADGDQVYCILTSSETCQSGGPATSNTLTAVVNPLLPVSVTIAADQNDVCAGTTVTFTATPVNGGLTPTYQWFVNDVEMSGFITGNYSYIPGNDDEVYCILTSGEVCQIGGPATSNTETMIVNPVLPVSVTIAADSNPVCDGTLVTFTATPVNGGPAPVYQWFVNGVEITGYITGTYAYTPANGDEVYVVMTSGETCQSGGPATSNIITMEVDPILPVSVTIASDPDPVCAGTTVTFTATPVNGGLAPAYQWFVNGVEKPGFTTDTYGYIPANGDEVYCILTSGEACQSGSPATSNTLYPTVNPLISVSVSISPDLNEVCAGTTVTFTALPVNGGTSPYYQWFVNGMEITGFNDGTYAYIPANGDQVYCILTSSEPCGDPATSGTVTMIVNPIREAGITIDADANPVYEGTAVTFTATPVNGGTAPSYQWRVNSVDVSGATGSTFTYVPVNNDQVSCVMTSSETCLSVNPVISNTVIMIVDPNVPVSVTIGADENPVCAGTTVTFTATPVNGGTEPAYEWKVNGVPVSGATSATFSYVPVNGDAIVCILTSSLEHTTGNPATSNTITMTVNPLLPVMVVIGADNNPVCAGTTVTFTAIPVNGGASPAYQWKVNGTDAPGATSSTFSYVPVNGDIVTCGMTSDEPCVSGNPATSNPVVMTVNALNPVGITIAADANPVCEGVTVQFSATPVNGGSAPQFQWFVNANPVSGATNSVYAYLPADQDAVTCVLTSNLACTMGNPATSNTVTMEVGSLLPVSVTIAADANPVCTGTSVTLTASPVNGGDSPVYQWYVNSSPVSGATGSVYSYVPAAGDALHCLLTSSSTCTSGNPATSNTVTVSLKPLPVPIITGTTNTCEGSSNLIYMTDMGMSNYTWAISGGGTITLNAGYLIVVTWHTGGAQWLRVNYTNASGCTATNPTQYNVTVHPKPVPTLSGAVAVCQGQTGVIYTTEAGMTNYVWNVSGGGINTGGGTSSSNTMTVTWNGAGAQWVSVSYSSAAGCAAAAPTMLNVTVDVPVTPQVTIAASENPVSSGTLVTFTASPVNGGALPIYEWKVNGSVIPDEYGASYSYIPLNNDEVMCTMTSDLTCVTVNPVTSNTITMTVSGIEENITVQNVTIANGHTECYNALQTITVAGTPTTFLIESGGSATFIAGQAIYFLPGTSVQAGGYLLATIAPDGPFCNGYEPPIPAVIAGTDEPVPFEQVGQFAIYPNPTSGNFTLSLRDEATSPEVRVEIFTMSGEKILSVNMGEMPQDIAFEDMPAGIYFIRIVSGGKAQTLKLVKTR